MQGCALLVRVKAGVLDNVGVTINTLTTKTVAGFAAGGGIEYALDQHWSVKGEYLFLGFDGSIKGCAPLGGLAPPGGPLNCTTSHYAGVQTIDLGLNYRF